MPTRSKLLCFHTIIHTGKWGCLISLGKRRWQHTAPRPLLDYHGVWLHCCDLHFAPTSPYTAARQAETQLGFLFGALRPTLAQNSFPFMGFRMVEIRACSDLDFFFYFFFKHTFYLARFSSGWVTARERHDLQTTKITDSIGQGGRKRKGCFSQNRHLVNLKYISSVCTSICPIKYCIL